jgi:hypothetical protein
MLHDSVVFSSTFSGRLPARHSETSVQGQVSDKWSIDCIFHRIPYVGYIKLPNLYFSH